jgi:hypothetical protein
MHRFSDRAGSPGGSRILRRKLASERKYSVLAFLCEAAPYPSH